MVSTDHYRTGFQVDEAAAQNLLSEAAENANYKQDIEDLNTTLTAKEISQEQYNQTSERLATTHHANLAKISLNR
ncbi:hypothetical protein R1N_29190 [Enterobacter asburiae]|nr:hypothetical protein EAA2563_27960 [Enterobacter asburiae]BCP70732.1 hypothetical protein R1N_29190 [Enterobacter asburiae]